MDLKRIIQKVKNQKGRSMLEMLAVLSIAGVLALMGLYGYQYAMEVNRENETLNRFSKVVAGARTSRILENQGFFTKYDSNENERPDFVPQIVDMHDVISNIGKDIITSKQGGELVDSYILAPLKNKTTNEQVEIYVNVQTPEAFTVHADNLTVPACVKIVRANLDYSFVFEGDDPTSEWRTPASVFDAQNAEAFCERVINEKLVTSAYQNPFIRQAFAAGKTGTLVLWFGPFESKTKPAPACKGSECCCETDSSGKTYLVGRVGCPAVNNTCIDCAQPNAQGFCVQKPGITCTQDEVCKKCTGDTPNLCGATCCSNDQSCDEDRGVCVDKKACPASRPTACGDNCCALSEECDAETKTCKPKGGNPYCVASVTQTSPCIHYETCLGEVKDVPGYTVQQCLEEGEKEIIWVYGDKSNNGKKCLFTLCKDGKNGQPCCGCKLDEKWSGNGFIECLNRKCVKLSAAVIAEINTCMGYPGTEDPVGPGGDDDDDDDDCDPESTFGDPGCTTNLTCKGDGGKCCCGECQTGPKPTE